MTIRQENDGSELTGAELDALLDRVWPLAREVFWLSLPWHLRLAPFRPG
jgi:hypothetical protein